MFLIWALTVMSVFFYVGAYSAPNFDVTVNNKAYYSRAVETLDSVEGSLRSMVHQQLDNNLYIYQKLSATVRYTNFLPLSSQPYVDTLGVLVSDSRALHVAPATLSVKDVRGRNLFVRIKNLPTVPFYGDVTLANLPSVLLMFPGANGKWDVKTDLVTGLPLDTETDPLFLDTQVPLPFVGDDIYRVVRFSDILERKIGESRAVIRYMVGLLSVYSNQEVFTLGKMCYPGTLADFESWVNPTVPVGNIFFIDGENTPMVYKGLLTGGAPSVSGDCAVSAAISSWHLEAGGY